MSLEPDEKESPTASAPSPAIEPPVQHAIVAFVGRTERGPVNQATLLTSYNHFRQIFGGHATFSYLSYAVQHFFLHGGKRAVVVRVANRANRALIRVPAGSQYLEVAARNPGSREFIRVSIDYDGLEARHERFNLVVQRLGRPGSQLVEDQEIFASVSINPDDERYVGNMVAHSRLIALRGAVPDCRPDATAPRLPGDPVRYLEIGVRGSDGSELTDYDVIGSNREGSGLFSLDTVAHFDLLCLPPPPGRDLGITSFLAAERYCERRRAMLIWDPPSTWSNPDTALIGARQSVLRGSNALTYYPRVRPRVERTGLPRALPACGAIAGVLSSKSDFGEWREGSQTDPLLKISLAPAATVSDEQAQSLRRAGVNVLAATPFGGAAFTGNVSMAAPGSLSGLWQRLDRRRLALFTISTLETIAAAVVDSEDPEDAFEARVAEFLGSLMRGGAFAGDTDDQAFSMRRLGGDLPRIRVGLALNRPGEFLLYDFDLTRAHCVAGRVPAFEADQLAG